MGSSFELILCTQGPELTVGQNNFINLPDKQFGIEITSNQKLDNWQITRAVEQTILGHVYHLNGLVTEYSFSCNVFPSIFGASKMELIITLREERLHNETTVSIPFSLCRPYFMVELDTSAPTIVLDVPKEIAANQPLVLNANVQDERLDDWYNVWVLDADGKLHQVRGELTKQQEYLFNAVIPASQIPEGLATVYFQFRDVLHNVATATRIVAVGENAKFLQISLEIQQRDVQLDIQERDVVLQVQQRDVSLEIKQRDISLEVDEQWRLSLEIR